MKMLIIVLCLFHVLGIIKGFPAKDTKESSEKSNLKTKEPLIPITSPLKDFEDVQKNVNETRSDKNATTTNKTINNLKAMTKNETREEGSEEKTTVKTEIKVISRKNEVSEDYAETKNETVTKPTILRKTTTIKDEGNGKTTLTTVRGMILNTTKGRSANSQTKKANLSTVSGNLASANLSDADGEDVQTKNGSGIENQSFEYSYEDISSSERKDFSEGIPIPKGVLCGGDTSVVEAGEEMSLFVPSIGGKCSWSFEAAKGVESLKLSCDYISFLGPPEGKGTACLSEELTVRDMENPETSYCGFHKDLEHESSSGHLSIALSAFSYKHEQNFYVHGCIVKAL